jgi:hypothetical protein
MRKIGSAMKLKMMMFNREVRDFIKAQAEDGDGRLFHLRKIID